MLQHLIFSDVHFFIDPLIAYERLKTKQNFEFLALKVAVGAYERWSLISLLEVPNIVNWLSNIW